MSRDILLNVRIIFINSGDDCAFDLTSVEPFSEIDEIVHDILTININTSWAYVLLNQITHKNTNYLASFYLLRSIAFLFNLRIPQIIKTTLDH